MPAVVNRNKSAVFRLIVFSSAVVERMEHHGMNPGATRGERAASPLVAPSVVIGGQIFLRFFIVSRLCAESRININRAPTSGFYQNQFSSFKQKIGLRISL